MTLAEMTAKSRVSTWLELPPTSALSNGLRLDLVHLRGTYPAVNGVIGGIGLLLHRSDSCSFSGLWPVAHWPPNAPHMEIRRPDCRSCW